MTFCLGGQQNCFVFFFAFSLCVGGGGEAMSVFARLLVCVCMGGCVGGLEGGWLFQLV